MTRRLAILTALAVSSILGQHTNRFHSSRILSNAVPLGFCSGGFSSTSGYDQQRRFNLRRTIRPLQRVLSKGYHSFLSEWLEKASQLPLAKPFGFNPGRQ